jgi:hypothetical protein
MKKVKALTFGRIVMLRKILTACTIAVAMLAAPATLSARSVGGFGGHGFGGMHSFGMGSRWGGVHSLHHAAFFPRHGRILNALAKQHFRFLRVQNNFNNFGLWPWGFGYYDEPYPYDDYLLGYQNYQTPTVVRPEPPQVKCEHSEQTRTVPSANGGTTEVTILRC